jgi:hypothetical protein
MSDGPIPPAARIVDMSEPNARPGFRVGLETLSNTEAWDAMADAANKMVIGALAARRSLLVLGFASTHALCKELDATARQYQIVFDAVRHQRTDKPRLDV